MAERADTEIRVEREGGEQRERVEQREQRGEIPAAMQVREEDLEPHAGLRYVARLFKILAILLILLLIAEIVIGVYTQGREAIPTLMVEATRLIVFAGLLWGAGEMALMLIESNHDLRATRILVGRLNGRVQRLEEAALGGVAPTGPAPPAAPRAGPPGST